jgi:diketogulonate reductase-like aldo/keto reductase
MPEPAAAAPPPILYGTAWKKERTAALVERALELGFRGVDTACQPKHYDERAVGRGVAAFLARGHLRESLYLQTKFTPLSGQDPKRVPYDARAPLAAQIEQSCRASLQNLRVSYLDALLLHSPLRPFEKTLEAWRAFEAAVAAGRVRALGISNCYEPAELHALWQAARIKPSVIQNRFYRDTGYDREIRAFCGQHGMRYQSFWTLTANPSLLAHPDVQALAERHAATPAQIVFRYLTQLGVTPLTGTSSERHMQEDLDIFRLTLETSDLERISRLLE